MQGVMPCRPCAILALLGAAAVLSACGGSTPVRDRDGTLRLKLDEYRIRPQALEVHTGVIRIVARNGGRLTHNVKVQQADDAQGSTTPVDFGGTPTAQPGQTVRSDPIRLEPGTYRLVCTIGNHENLGQYAELRVVAKGAS
jgi:uncharacterized cupredoxin-like copper-binding protein